MLRRDELEAATALYEEAVAMYEAAKAEFERLKTTIAETGRSGRTPTSSTLAEEDKLRARLFVAAAKLSSRHRRLLPPG
jgi:hypothetical protein